MTDDTQVAHLLRSATADLELPTGVVARATSRGRSRRRRHVAGTTLVSLALVGLGAALVPQLLPAGTDAPPSIGPFASPSTSTSVTAVPDAIPGHRIPIKADRGANTLVNLLPNGSINSPANDPDVAPGEIASRALFAGGTVEVTVRRFHSQADIDKAAELGGTLETARQACGFGDHTECSRLPDGSWFDYGSSGTDGSGDPEAGAYMQTKVTVWTTDNYVVQVIAFDSHLVVKELPVGTPGWEPVLTVEQLKKIATSPDWFRAA
jgi:hypothetical protein